MVLGTGRIKRAVLGAVIGICLCAGCGAKGEKDPSLPAGPLAPQRPGETSEIGRPATPSRPEAPESTDGRKGVLPSASIDRGRITVSGVSSGGFMAVQFHLAHSATVSGAASVAGGIYWCAEGEKTKSFRQCMTSPGLIQVGRYVAKARAEAARGEIDSLENLARARVYLFASPADSVILSEETDKLREFYAAFTPDAQIRLDHSLSSAHGFPTEAYGNDCDQLGPPWLLKCGYDTAGKILEHLYGPLRAKTAADPARLIEFEQAVFGAAEARLYQTGSIYIPKSCEKGSRARCALHIALHGCQMNPDDIQGEFREHGGYNEWAEANKIVVLYPQAQKFSENPYGCWDWFGYTGADYVVKKGPQIKAIKAMIDRIMLE